MESASNATPMLESAALLIGGAFVVVSLSVRLGVPAILGFLLTGLVLGPHVLGLLQEEGAALGALGELGVILLMFSLGLTFSWTKLVELRRLIFGIGGAQVGITAVIVALGANLLLDVSWPKAILLGAATAMSSTALSIKQLEASGALGHAQGRTSIAILLFQDLATVGFLVFIDALQTASATGHGVEKGFFNVLGLFAALILARKLLIPLAQWIERSSNNELPQLLALFLVLSTAVGAHYAGLSPALGAFIAGMLIGEGDARNVVEREVRPFRDLLLGIFFVSLGAQMDITILGQAFGSVLAWLAVIVFLKAAILAAILYLADTDAEVSAKVALILAHAGEFSLLLVSLSVGAGLLDNALAQPFLLAIGISLFIAPLLISLSARENLVRQSLCKLRRNQGR